MVVPDRGMRVPNRRIFPFAAIVLVWFATAAPQAVPPVVLPPTILNVHREVQNRMNVLAVGLHNEVIICLTGHVADTVAVVTGFFMPRMSVSGPHRSAAQRCPEPRTMAVWHNHVPIALHYPPGCMVVALGGPSCFGTLAAVTPDPRDMCHMSKVDRHTARELNVPFFIVQISPTVVCWWPRSQAIESDTVALPAARGQRSW